MAALQRAALHQRGLASETAVLQSRQRVDLQQADFPSPAPVQTLLQVRQCFLMRPVSLRSRRRAAPLVAVPLLLSAVLLAALPLDQLFSSAG